jgi:hypothetical protein
MLDEYQDMQASQQHGVHVQEAGRLVTYPAGVAAQHRVLVPDHQQSAAGPQIMASLRNLAITILRLAGTTSIAAALRYHARRPARPLRTIMKC